MEGEIRHVAVGGVHHVTIHNPRHRNAVTSTMLDGLAEVMGAPEGACVVLSGDDEAFCAGADLQELESADTAGRLEDRLARAADAIAGCRVPVLAAIEGPCLGAGVELVAACDIRVVATTAFFEVPAARLGILYRPAGLERLWHRIGDHATRRLLLANERLSADALGSFAAPLVPPGTARVEAERLAAHLATLSSDAVAATKSLLDAIERDALDEDAWVALRDDLRARALRPLGEPS